uniref:Uncharacterized protein n=1 Tax=Arundo donax TaxID=35708 RepID=A0A0A9CWF0_ARUDO
MLTRQYVFFCFKCKNFSRNMKNSVNAPTSRVWD